MLLKLSARGLRPLGETSTAPFLGRITETPDVVDDDRSRAVLLLRQPVTSVPSAFRACLLFAPFAGAAPPDTYVLAAEHRYLADGDVVRLDPGRRTLTALFRRSSPSNAFLVTERCDNYCLMCSQPPKDRDDSHLVDELLGLIPLVSPDAREIGITGGEPALLGERLVDLLAAMRQHLPRTAVHVLSNGRAFKDANFARAIADVKHPDLMLGIPLYSDLPEDHDYVVQARGAYEETIAGILNLKRAGVRVEIRFVIHAKTYRRLPEFARFLSRNLRFVDHVALMGLELMGFARSNLDLLWIDPLDYQDALVGAVRTLSAAGVRTSIYNHPLCVVPTEIHSFARRSISDWKNTFMDECIPCARKNDCAGFFESSRIKRSRGVRPL